MVVKYTLISSYASIWIVVGVGVNLYVCVCVCLCVYHHEYQIGNRTTIDSIEWAH